MLHELQIAATKARILILEGVHAAKAGHPGGSLSCVDALTTLYFHEMKVYPLNPDYPDRDRFVLSKGHCAPALYAVLALKGFFPKEDIRLLRSIKGHMSGHPDMVHIKGVDMSTGSLGQGISTAVGMALAAKQLKKDYRTYTILGDGEMDEGQVWEAIMAAAKWKLDNLCAMVDVNGLQIDGNDYDEIVDALAEARNTKGKPTVILLKTQKGRGVSFMEKAAEWHGKAPNDKQYELAIAELKAHLAGLEAVYGR